MRNKKIIIKYIFFIFIIFLSVSTVSYSQIIRPINNNDDVKNAIDSKKGKVVLVNFWATWCKPCVAEFPELIKLYNEYKDKNLEVIFISTDVPEDIETKVKPFMEKNKVEFDSYFVNTADVTTLINYFDENWQGDIPSTYIYDKNGILTASITGKKTYTEFEELIKMNIN